MRSLTMSVDPRRVVARYLSAASGKLTAAMRNTVNKVLIQQGMDGNGRFKSPNDALSQISKILGHLGIEWGEVINGFPLRQPQGTMNIDLALSNPEDPFSPTTVTNSMLAFQWYRMEESGNYEVVAYLS
jgi:hypothetical protein